MWVPKHKPSRILVIIGDVVTVMVMEDTGKI
jgi:hypothetical protein